MGDKVKVRRDNWEGLEPTHQMYEFYPPLVTETYRASLEPHLGSLRRMGKAQGKRKIFEEGTADYVQHLKHIFRYTKLMRRRHVAMTLLDQVKKGKAAFTS